jgi:hypothetical protein
MGFLSSIYDSSFFTPGKKDARQARRILRGTSFSQGQMTGAGGLSAGFGFDDQGRMSTTQSLGQFQPLFEQMLGLSGQFLGRAGDMANNLDAQFDPQRQGFQDIFATASQIAAQDPLERGRQVSDILRQRRAGSARQEINNTFDRLFASGGLFNQVTREQTLDAESRRLADEDLGFEMAGLNFGEQSVQNAFNRAAGASASGLGLEQSLNSIFGGALDLGTGMSQNAAAMSQLPLNFLQAITNLQNIRNTSEMNRAGMFLNTSQQFQNMSPQMMHTQNVTNFRNFTEGMSNIMGSVAMSDRRLKTNVRQVGSVDGIDIYSYDYLDGTPGIGVMADEVPWAAFDVGGYKAVDYTKVWS